MTHEVLMPQLSENVEEGVVVAWFVEPGAVVAEGDLIAEVQVEKIASEVRAPAAGTILELRVQPNEVIKQGEAIALIGEVAAPPAATAVTRPSPTAERAATEQRVVVAASPAARRVARELGVDLTAIAGSGPDGRITENDVRAAATPAAAVRVEPLSMTRRTIAERMQRSLATTAQLTETAEVDVTELAAELERLSELWGRRASYTEAVVKACATCLRSHPRVAALWTKDGLAYQDAIDIGVAVALDDGLIVPVVRAADGKDLEALNREIADLAERARGGTLSMADVEGGVFSITNLGAYPIDAFTPVLNPPQTAVLGMGRARPRPAVVDGRIEARTLMTLSLTFDHRVLDGAPAAAFLADVVSLLEEPAWLGARVL